MSDRIGVFICECGPNIKAVVDVERLADYASGLDDVVRARTFGLLCSQGGHNLLQQEIEAYQLNRVVVAGCTPKEHEHTFRQILQKTGLNPFMLQVANLREQCAWVQEDRTLATAKAQALVRAAVQRVARHEPIEPETIPCQPDVMVVGAGVAGLNAALTLAQKDRRVFLVEKGPCLGGKVALFEDLYPHMECAACVLDPLLDQVLHHDRIEVLTLSEVKAVRGYYGNFKIEINRRARSIDETKCIGCGVCLEVCPVKAPNEFNAGLDERGAVYIPYPGALPHLALIDKERCLHYRGESCTACHDACPFDAVRLDEEDTLRELAVGAIVLATGYDPFDPHSAPQYGYRAANEVYTALAFERLLNTNGPTQGRILMKNGQAPRTITFIHCVGSRSSRYHPHCSGICCLYNLKFMQRVKNKQPETHVRGLFVDLCLPGKDAQQVFDRVAATEGVTFIRRSGADAVSVDANADGLLIQYTDPLGQGYRFSTDMVVLATALEGSRDARHLGSIFDIPQDTSGFWLEEHRTLAPVATINDGIFIAGCAQGPMDVPSAVAQGQAAAGRILSRLTPGARLTLEPLTVRVDPDLCSGCRLCVELCAYKALQADVAGQSVTIEPTLCRGCGTCVAACPAGALAARHFSDKALRAELLGLMHARHRDQGKDRDG